MVEEMLISSGFKSSNLYSSDRVRDARKILKTNSVNLVLLDLSLPDSVGINTFHAIRQVAQKIPVMILTGLSDTELALQAIREGAQDYLVKGEINQALLCKSIKYSLERKRNQQNLFESNERFDMAAKASNEVIWDWHIMENNIFLAGDNYKKLFGYDFVGGNLPSELLYDSFHPEEKQRVLKKLRDTIKNDLTEIWEDEYRLRRVNGTYAHVHNRGYIVYDNDRNPVRMIGSMQDITDKTRLENEIALQQKLKLQQITEISLNAQEKERSQIAQELHDNINQILAASRMYFQAGLNNKIKSEGLIRKGIKNVSIAIEEIRKLSKSLIVSGLRELGLIKTIQELVQDIRVIAKIKIRLDANGFDEKALDLDKKITIYRIVQEQLNNIIKHAHASEVNILVRAKEEGLFLNITDNGKGFDTKARRYGIGISNIMSRVELYNGKFEIESEIGKGCSLLVELNSKEKNGWLNIQSA